MVTTRRDVLALGSGLIAGAGLLPGSAAAQGRPATGDADLAALRSGRPIVLKNAIVLTLDPQVGDFASGDMLIAGGKIREVRPQLTPPLDAVVLDATNRIVIPD